MRFAAAIGDGVSNFEGFMRHLDYLTGTGLSARRLLPAQPSPRNAPPANLERSRLAHGRCHLVRGDQHPACRPPSASNKVWKVFPMVAANLSSDAADDLAGREPARRFHERPLALHPGRCNWMQPGPFARPAPGQQTDTAVALALWIVGPDLGPDGSTPGPGGMIPQPHRDPLALDGRPLVAPGQTGRRHVAHGPAIYKPQPDGVGVGPEPPRAGQGGGSRPRLRERRGAPPEGLPHGPAVRSRLSPTTPPGRIGTTEPPGGRPGGPVDQAVAGRFLNAFGGSGLVIQRVAHRQCPPNRLRAWRTVARPTWARGRAPCPTALGGSAQRPGAARVATGARPFVAQCPYQFGVEHQAGALGTLGLGRPTGHTPRLAGMEGMVHARGGPPQRPGHVRGAWRARTGAPNLAPPQGKRLRGAPSGVALLMCRGRQPS